MSEFRKLATLGVPVVAGQFGMMLLHAVDTLMVGRYGVSELAAASLATQWIFLTLTLGMGLVMGIDPLVAQRHGAGDGTGTGRALHDGLVVAVLASVAVSVCWLLTGPVLIAAGQDPELVRLAERYVWIQLPSVLPFLVWVALRSYLQGREIMAPAMWVMVPVNLLNVLFNAVFIFGAGPIPAWGLDGAGLATCLSRILTFVLLLGWVRYGRLHQGAWEAPRLRQLLSWRTLRRPLGLGAPTSLQMGFEVLAFGLTALVAGRIGQDALAAHSIVISVTALLFMVPLGISIGTTTRIGNLVGARATERVRAALRSAAVLGACAIALNVSVLTSFAGPLASWYTRSEVVRDIAVEAFFVAAVFQVSDVAQIVAGGALRGMGRTRAPAVAVFAGYYVFGLPLGYWLGVVRGQGLTGLWWGLAGGLSAVALLVVGWLLWVLRGPVRGGEPILHEQRT